MVSPSVRWIPSPASQVQHTDLTPRFYPVPFLRLALRPFTFSNGMTVPAGTLVAIPASAIHMDERIYPNADEFDGFRFSKLRESEGGGSMTSMHQAVSASSEHLFFGFGRHTWCVPAGGLWCLI
jgi:cytochrome P450